MKHVVLGLCLSLFGCGGDKGSESPIEGSKKLKELTAEETTALCEWSIELQGGPGKSFDCGDDFEVSVATVEECQEEFALYTDCDATVADAEACVNEISDEPCSFSLGSACQKLFEQCLSFPEDGDIDIDIDFD